MVRANHRFRQVPPRSMNGLRSMANEAIAQEPLPVAFAAFGAGLGVGVGLGLLISEMECFQKAESSTMIEQIGEAVARLLPDALARHLPR